MNIDRTIKKMEIDLDAILGARALDAVLKPKAIVADELLPVEVLDVTMLCARDACIVELTVMIEDDVVIVQGTSRRSPGDEPDDQVAYLLAYGRAYEALSKKLLRRAQGLVKHHDDIRAARPEQRTKAENFKKKVVAIASNDPRIQRQAVRAARVNEKSWSN